MMGFDVLKFFAIEAHGAFIRGEKTTHDVEDRCLAGTIRANQTSDCTFGDTNTHVIENFKPAERDADIFDRK